MTEAESKRESLGSGVYRATIEFNNTDGKQASTLRTVTLTVNP
jgi:hypothetical protein